MNRFDEINSFLKSLAKIYIQNPDLDITDDTFYSFLVDYGLSDNDLKNDDIRPLFSEWKNYFSNRNNIKVYVDDQQKRFLQFQKLDFDVENVDCIKIYLPFKGKKIDECVKILFDFIEQNNISHMSKVSDCLRADSVVLRIPKVEDANKILKFIEKNSKLSNAFTPTNPFLIKNGKAGLAMDDMLSYNGTLSMILGEYFRKHKLERTLKEVSINNFRQFIVNYYNNTFCNCTKLDDFLKLDAFKESVLERYDGNECKCLVNYCQIIKLIAIAIDQNKDMMDYSHHVAECNNKKYLDSLDAYFKNKLQKTTEAPTLESDLFTAIDTLNEYIIYASRKYGDSEVISILNLYINTNSINNITRDNDFRKKFSKYLSPTDIRKITNNDLANYISNIQTDSLNSKIEDLNIASKETMREYGFRQLYYALSKVASEGNYEYFLDPEKIKLSVSKDEIESLCFMVLSSSGLIISKNDDLFNLYCNQISEQLNMNSEKAIV